MQKVIVVVGYGPGISHAVAEKFGAEGFSVVLVGRTRSRLESGVANLTARGVSAAPFTADAGDPAAIARAVAFARTRGALTAIVWNAYSGAAGDVLAAPADEIRAIADVPVVGLLTAVREALPDLKANGGSVLVTNGGLGLFDPAVDEVAVSWNAMGLAIANSAKHKLVGLLHHKLSDEGVHVAEVTVTGAVKGTAFDQGHATIEPSSVAGAFWELHTARVATYVTIR